MAKVAIIYDRNLRPDTTGIYAEAALRSLGHEVFYYPPLTFLNGELVFRGYEDLPRDCDLYLQVDDDLAYPGVDRKPSAYWCIDTHRMAQMIGGMDRRVKAKSFTHVFAAQRDGAEQLGAYWLPLACDPSRHYPLPQTPKRYDWCFVGNQQFEERQRILGKVRERFPQCFLGSAFGDDMRKIYSSSKLILNIAIGNDVNMRVFEAQACGGLLITSATENGEDELFPDLVCYRTVEDLLEKMAYYLAKDRERADLAIRQGEIARSDHSYEARMQMLLRRCL